MHFYHIRYYYRTTTIIIYCTTQHPSCSPMVIQAGRSCESYCPIKWKSCYCAATTIAVQFHSKFSCALMVTRAGRNGGAYCLISYVTALERPSLRHTTPNPSCSEMVTRAGRDNKSLCPTACVIHAMRQPPLYSMSHGLSCLLIEMRGTRNRATGTRASRIRRQ